MNNNHLIVFDFETTGLDIPYHEPVELAAQAYDARTLEAFPKEDGGRFVSLMKPLYPERLDEPKCAEALRFNKITKEEVLAAPDQGVVWKNFVEWTKKYNPKGTKWSAPIPCGKNIRGFDLKIVEEMNRLHGPKKEKTVLFNTKWLFDLDDILFLFFENETEPASLGMDVIRDYFGIPKDGAHRAELDVEQEGALIIRFIKLIRRLRKEVGKDGEKRIKFAQSFRGLRRENE